MNREPLHAEGQLSPYTAAEILQIQAVLNSLFFGKTPEKNHKPKLILTGGYPGAGKSAFAHQFASTNREFIRIDVDDNCLFTIPGYQKDYLEQKPEVAYTKWRPAANWIAQNAVKKALDENYNLILVGTATSPQIPDLIAAAKEKKYSTELHGFAAPLDICLKRSKPENRFSYLDHTGDISVMIPQDHITGKRTLFNQALPALIRNVQKTYMNWNPLNTRTPSLAFRCATMGEEENTHIIIMNPSATLAFMNCAGWKKEQGTPILPALASHLKIKI